MSYHYSIKTHRPFHEVEERITAALQDQGFGIITSIDLKETLKKKLDVSFRNYRILGACNPQYAYQAISMDSHLGVMLPCNIVIQEHENGEVEVSAINPAETLDKESFPNVADFAEQVSNRLRKAVDSIHLIQT
jgi:uncharacterized protein (DUF302 family)